LLSKTSTSNRKETISTVETVEIVSMTPLWTKSEVKQRIQTISKETDLEVEVIQNVYYPYLQFEYQLIVRGTKGKAFCFVDMVGGVEAVSGALPKTERARVPKIQVMPCKVDPEAAQRKAETYIIYAFTHRRKVLIAPELFIRSKHLVYRPFFILKCDSYGKKKVKFHLMFDAVSGQYQRLPLKTPIKVEEVASKQRAVQVQGVKRKLRKVLTGELQ